MNTKKQTINRKFFIKKKRKKKKKKEKKKHGIYNPGKENLVQTFTS